MAPLDSRVLTESSLPATRGRTFVGRAFAIAIAIVLGGLGLFAVCGLLAIQSWPLELTHHFTRHGVALALGATALLAVLRRWRLAAAAGLIAAGFVATLLQTSSKDCSWSALPWPIARAVPTSPAAGQRLTIEHYNIHFLNRPSPWMRRWFAGMPADILVVVEASPAVVATAREVEGGYPYRLFVETEKEIEGVIVLSRYPIVDHEVVRTSANAWPAVIARIVADEASPVWLIAAHARNPVLPQGLRERDWLFAGLTKRINSLEGTVIVAGDFNATPYTPAFQRFLAAAGLHRDCFPPATFPAAAGRFGIPIDHLLVRGGRLQNLSAYRPLGSDHRALTAELSLP